MSGVAVRSVMIPCLVEVAREMRREHSGSVTQIAARHGVRETTVIRFEQGKTQPRDLDGLIWAYAVEAGVDPRDIWRRALARWDDGP